LNSRAWKLDTQFTKDIQALDFEKTQKDVPPTKDFPPTMGFRIDIMTMEFWMPLVRQTCAKNYAQEERQHDEKLQPWLVSKYGGIPPFSTSNCSQKLYNR